MILFQFDLIFGICILFNAAWTLFFVSGSVIRVTAMCLHSYYNIWFVAKASWTSFVKRRIAVKKIDQLQDASASELAELKDICAICFEPMEAAKITSCRHFYHAICLRKWQYVQVLIYSYSDFIVHICDKLPDIRLINTTC